SEPLPWALFSFESDARNLPGDARRVNRPGAEMPTGRGAAHYGSGRRRGESPVSESRRTLLAVHAHPDDEAITTAGTFLRCHDLGIRTVLVMCTRGECGEISDPALPPPETLGQVRTGELEAAAALQAVDRIAWLGYRD